MKSFTKIMSTYRRKVESLFWCLDASKRDLFDFENAKFILHYKLGKLGLPAGYVEIPFKHEVSEEQQFLIEDVLREKAKEIGAALYPEVYADVISLKNPILENDSIKLVCEELFRYREKFEIMCKGEYKLNTNLENESLIIK